MYQGNTIKHKSSELNYLYRSSFPDHDQGVGIIVHLEIQGVAANASPFFFILFFSEIFFPHELSFICQHHKSISSQSRLGGNRLRCWLHFPDCIKKPGLARLSLNLTVSSGYSLSIILLIPVPGGYLPSGRSGTMRADNNLPKNYWSQKSRL